MRTAQTKRDISDQEIVERKHGFEVAALLREQAASGLNFNP
jgi:hypothetical protein